jgi:dTDP-4-amino-4,6-dideoxygalactose transaminase
MQEQRIEDLAIFGGARIFNEPLHVGRPNIGDREKLLNRVNDILDRKWLTNKGTYVQELEQKLAAYVNVNHCILICNATVGLEIAIRALGLKGEVIIPSFTFIATAHALQWQEITPIFCDIDPFTHNLDPRIIEALITPRTTGIIGVHVWGRPCEIDTICKIAQRYNLKLLFDAAHAFGCKYNGKRIGNFGDAEVFSFHATKFFNTFEGGAITTNDEELASKIRLMKNFGFAGRDDVVYLGTNGKMSEVSAAMGLTGLECLDEFIECNFLNYQKYQELLGNIPGIRLIEYDILSQPNYQYVILEVNEQKTGISRDQLVEILRAENILARRYFYPGCHQMEPYRSYFPHAGLLLPETEKLVTQVMSLPTGTAVGEIEIQQICDLIRFVIENGFEISQRLN